MRRTFTIAIACAAVAAGSAWSADRPLSELEQRGKQIYSTGESPSNAPITAVVSRGATPIPASILPCSGCHGDDGTGRPEGGVVPPDVSWKVLSASYGHKHSYGRSHPAYTEDNFAASVLAGVDPAGNQLDVAMPRYSMPPEDLEALVAYLKVIATDYDAGVSSDAIRIGTVLPVEGPLASVGTMMRKVIEALFQDINDDGGIHGRRLELVVAEYAEDPVQSLWHVRDMLQSGDVFAMVSGFGIGLSDGLADVAEELEVPMVGPFTQSPREGNGLERHSFYLTGGLEQQAAVLIRKVAEKGRKVAVVHPADPEFSGTLQRVSKELAAHGGAEPVEISFTPPYLDVTDVAQTLENLGVQAVLFLGPAQELKRLANVAAENGYAPDMLLPGVFAAQPVFDISPEFQGKIRIGYSSIPADHTPEGIRAFETLHTKHEFGYEHSAAQISAYVAVEVLVEGLKRAGRGLSRDGLLTALEGLADYQPGLMPPISYNRSRRIGAFGGYVMTLDVATKKFEDISNWISLQL